MDHSNLELQELRLKIEAADEIVPLIYFDDVRQEWMCIITAKYNQAEDQFATTVITIGCEQNQEAGEKWLRAQLDRYRIEDYSDEPDMYDRAKVEGVN